MHRGGEYVLQEIYMYIRIDHILTNRQIHAVSHFRIFFSRSFLVRIITLLSVAYFMPDQTVVAATRYLSEG